MLFQAKRIIENHQWKKIPVVIKYAVGLAVVWTNIVVFAIFSFVANNNITN